MRVCWGATQEEMVQEETLFVLEEKEELVPMASLGLKRGGGRRRRGKRRWARKSPAKIRNDTAMGVPAFY